MTRCHRCASSGPFAFAIAGANGAAHVYCESCGPGMVREAEQASAEYEALIASGVSDGEARATLDAKYRGKGARA